MAFAALPRIRRKGLRRFWKSGRRSSRESKSKASPQGTQRDTGDSRGSRANSPRRHRGAEKNTKEKINGIGIFPTKLFNQFITHGLLAFDTERLFQSAYDGLLRSGAKKKDVALVRVPGAFEIPSAARTLAETKKYDAILCIGCLLRGDTAHYDVIVNEVTRGIGQSAQETGVPHAFGVLTCETLEQAIDRAGLKMGNKGFEAALAAVEMASLRESIVGKGKNVVRRLSLAVRKSKTKGRNNKPKR